MDGSAIMTVSAAVVGLVEYAKWANLPKKWAPFAVLALSAIGVVLWGWSQGTMERATAFQYFTGWIAVMTSAAGVYGLVRESRETVTSMRKDP
jgi:hypothetical protein